MVCAPAALLLEANPGDRVVDDAAAVGSLPDANPGDRVFDRAELALALSIGTAEDDCEADPLLEPGSLEGARD